MRFCLIDFETASACDLRKAGAWRYAEDPTTEILCLGYTFGDAGEVWVPGDNRSHTTLMEAISNPDCMFIAHNVAFEKAIWRNIMMPVFGWPDIPNGRWHDTQAVCAMKGLPLKLEKASVALRLHVQKDTEGTKATLALGRTNKAGYYTRTPEKLERVYAYCKTDLAGELELHRRIRGLGASERRTWLLDQTINERGVRLDLGFVSAAQRVVDQSTVPLLAEFRSLTGIDKVGSPKFLDWLHAQGADIPNLQKETIAKFLGDEDDEDSLAGDDEDYRGIEDPQIVLPFAYRRPLEIRRILGSASIKKLTAMESCVCADGRAHGLLQYHGAGPGRWAGRLLQPQNFPRPTLKIDGEGHDPEQLVEAILTGDAEYVRLCFGEPIEAVANGLRHALVSADGYSFEVGDYSKIECVIVLALAGHADVAEKVLKMGSAVYTDMAETIFRRKVTKNDLKEYTVGKGVVLGAGFQMGWRKFQSRYAKDQSDETCQEAIRTYREDFAPNVPKLWRALEEAAVKTVWEGLPREAYGIEYALKDGWLTCRLPSGRLLWYYDPRKVRKAMPWDKDDIRPGFEYSAWKMGQWKRISAYGGLLTENVVQATARDIMVSGMFNAEAAGHPVVLTVHDEIVTEVAGANADAELLRQLMCDIPQWAKARRIPVEAETWTGARYRK